MFGVHAAIYVWLTLWASLHLSIDELTSQGRMKPPGYPPLSYSEVRDWIQLMNNTMSQIPPDDVEFYLPQLSAVSLRGDVETRSIEVTSVVAEELALFLQAKCRENHMVGLQLLWQLKAAAGSAASSEMRSRFKALISDYELATMYGDRMPEQFSSRRERLYIDTVQFVDGLVHLSRSLANVTEDRRPEVWHRLIGMINQRLLRRMNLRGEQFYDPGIPFLKADTLHDEAAREEIAQAAKYALPLPLRLLAPGAKGGRCSMRILRIRPDLGRRLSSQKGVPCLITAEVTQTGIRHGSDRIYSEGPIRVTAADVVDHRTVPRELLRELRETYAPKPAEKRKIVLHGHSGANSYSTTNRENVYTDTNTVPQDGNLGRKNADGGAVRVEEEDRAFFSRAFEQWQSRSREMKDILHNVFHYTDEAQTRYLRSTSPFGHLKGWQLNSYIVKAGDDVRQEALAMQVICLVEQIFREEKVPLWLRPYAISCAGHNAGLVEFVTDACSISDIKKRSGCPNLQDFFERLYMGKLTGLYGKAQDNFIRSLAGYSLVTYLLQVKDRHNANIMLDTRGHIIHIDFGFILGASPGLWTHETAPFKLTQEYIDIIGGEDSPNMRKFERLFLAGFRAIQKHIDAIAAVVQVVLPANDEKALKVVEKLRERFTHLKFDEQILGLVRDSSCNYWTSVYDLVQEGMHGISK